MSFSALIDRVEAFLSRHGWVPIATALIAVAGVWAFYALADEVLEGDTQHYDERIVRALRRSDDPARPIGPDWLANVGRDVTALGSVTVLTIVTVGVCGYLVVARRLRSMVVVVIATVGGLTLSLVLKDLFGRERPSIVPHLDTTFTSSFPSGHAMLSSVVYLTHGTLLMRVVKPWRVRLYILGVAMALPFLVGVSRVYLGVHYPTDVLAGWTAGLVWGLACWTVARLMQHRGAIEPSGHDAGQGTTPSMNMVER